MKLNKWERLSAYQILLAEAFMMNEWDCLCGIWERKITGKWPHKLHLLLPELFKNSVYKNRNWYWFETRKQRLTALTKCIQELEEQLF